MQVPVHIAFKGLSSSAALEERIQAKVAKLERLHHRILAIRVLVEASSRQDQHGHVYTVRVDVTIPGAELFASREVGRDHNDGDVHVALRDAFEAMTRQLEHVEPHRNHATLRG